MNAAFANDSLPAAALGARIPAMRAAQACWAGAGVAARIEALRGLIAAMAARREAIIGALVADTGRQRLSEAEFAGASTLIERWSNIAPGLLAETPAIPTREAGVSAQHQYVPYSLVGVITPWNSPLGLSMLDALPALIAGCAVIVKPSEICPRFVAPLAEAIAATPMLCDVFAVVSGGPTLGGTIVDGVDAICFTGSVETGRRVAARAGERLIPAFLELGGKDPAIVLADADPRRAAAGILWSGTLNSGQLCHSIERVYVETALFEPFIEALIDEAGQRRLSISANGGELGPFIDPRQADIVERHLADARARGARVHCGGELRRFGGRVWLEPTVLTHVNHGMLIMREETFGPILPVMRVADAEEALALANDSPFGLSASIWGSEGKALALARRLNAGAVSINDASLAAILMDAEKNAFGVSGLGGLRMGPAGLTRFLRKKALLVNARQDRSPWW